MGAGQLVSCWQPEHHGRGASARDLMVGRSRGGV
jgi:hypothetical protein